MKLNKSIDLSHNSIQKISKLYDCNINTNTVNRNYFRNISRNIKNPLKDKKQKIFSHNSFNNELVFKSFDNITIQQVKKKNNRNQSRNSKLSPAKYIKPLYYMLNNQIKAINRQFTGYRNERYFINFNYNLFSSFKNGDNIVLKTLNNNTKEGINEYLYMNNFNNKNKIHKKRKQNCSFDDRIKNIRFNNNYNYILEDKEMLNKKTIMIQACFRSFINRYKLYKNLKDNNKDIKYSETISKLINNYFNKIDSIRKKFNNNCYINGSFNYINNALIQCKNDNFTIKPKKKKLKQKLSNNNFYLIKKQKELLEKEKETFIKEKKKDELKIKELTQENNKLKKKNSLFEKNKANFDKLKEENEVLKEKLKLFEEKNKEFEILENKYKNLVEQNETLYQENVKLNEQIEENIKNLMEINKKNQEKIKIYEESMNNQEAIINENLELNKLNKEMENKINQLIKEKDDLQEKIKINTQNNINNKEDISTNIKKENELLVSENEKIKEKNEELQNLVEEMKKKISKLSKAYKYTNKYINETSNNQSREKSNIITPHEKNEENNIKNKEDEELYENNHGLYLKRIRDRKPLDKEQLEKEERMKNLLRRRINDMKDDLHRCFMRFYYNGIFVQMQKKKSMNDPVTKVVKSRRFSDLINKFNKGSNSKVQPLEKIDRKNIKRFSSKSHDDKINIINKKEENTIYEEKDE